MPDWFEVWREVMRLRETGLIRDRVTSKYAFTALALREYKKRSAGVGR